MAIRDLQTEACVELSGGTATEVTKQKARAMVRVNPDTPKWDAWRAYYRVLGKRKIVDVMDACRRDGRPFLAPAALPPGVTLDRDALPALEPLGTELPWYVVQAEPQHEAIVAAALIARHIRAFCPQEPKSVKRNRFKRDVRLFPMVPTYLFAQFDALVERSWDHLRAIAGFRHVLSFAGQPVPVSMRVIQILRAREAAKLDGARMARPMPVDVGAWVQLQDVVAFSGFFGQVTELLPAKDEVRVEIDLFGRKTPLTVPVNQVTVIDSEDVPSDVHRCI